MSKSAISRSIPAVSSPLAASPSSGTNSSELSSTSKVLPVKRPTATKNRPKRKPGPAGSSKKPLTNKQRVVKSAIEYRAQVERAMHAYQEKLFTRQTNTSAELSKIAAYLQPTSYAEIIEERNLEEWCGYPLCSNQKLPPGPRFRIKSYKIFDQRHLEQFCSVSCARRSEFFQAQLSRSPVWAREGLLEGKWTGEGNRIVILEMEEEVNEEKINEVLYGGQAEKRNGYVKKLLEKVPKIPGVVINNSPEGGLIIKENLTNKENGPTRGLEGEVRGEHDLIEGYRIEFKKEEEKPTTLILKKDSSARMEEEKNEEAQGLTPESSDQNSRNDEEDESHILEEAMTTMIALKRASEQEEVPKIETQAAIHKLDAPNPNEEISNPPMVPEESIVSPSNNSSSMPTQVVHSSEPSESSSEPSILPSVSSKPSSILIPPPSPTLSKNPTTQSPKPRSPNSARLQSPTLPISPTTGRPKKKPSTPKPRLSFFGRIWTLLDRIVTPQTRLFVQQLKEIEVVPPSPIEVQQTASPDEGVVIDQEIESEFNAYQTRLNITASHLMEAHASLVRPSLGIDPSVDQYVLALVRTFRVSAEEVSDLMNPAISFMVALVLVRVLGGTRGELATELRGPEGSWAKFREATMTVGVSWEECEELARVIGGPGLES